MNELIEYIAKSIVSHPEEVTVTQEDKDGKTILKLHVAPDDKGKIIGRHGRIADSIRILLRIAATKRDDRAFLDIT
jgi:predicted RNA-binding protein YlqC (UPF0109 family)